MAKKDLTADVYGNNFSVEELQSIRRRLAKRANNNLRDLSRNSSPITGEVYNSYGAAVDALDYLKKRNRRYFSEKLELSRNKTVLKAEILRLQKFLKSPSATVKGQHAIEQKRLETFEAKGIEFADTKEFYNFLSSDTFHGLTAIGFDSSTIVEAYERARKRERGDDTEAVENLKTALNEYREGERVTIKSLWEKLDVSPFDD